MVIFQYVLDGKEVVQCNGNYTESHGKRGQDGIFSALDRKQKKNLLLEGMGDQYSFF